MKKGHIDDGKMLVALFAVLALGYLSSVIGYSRNEQAAVIATLGSESEDAPFLHDLHIGNPFWFLE